MENTVEVFSHDPSLVQLDGNLVSGEWSEEDWDGNEVKEGEVFPGWNNSRSSTFSEIIFLDIEQVACGEHGSTHKAEFEDVLRVVHSLNNGIVLLPVVILHFYLINNFYK